MRQAIKGALISGLGFPGLGQLVLKQHRRGLAFLAVAAACLAVVINSAMRKAMDSLANMDPASLGDPNALASVASQTANAGGDWSYTLALTVLTVCWAWSIVDAWRIGRAQDENSDSGG